MMVLKGLPRQKQRELKNLLDKIDGCNASPEEKHRLREVWMQVKDDIIDLEAKHHG